MKKVLSVLLAAAMVMGMSVSAFAANDQVWGKKSTDIEVTDTSVEELSFWENMYVVHADGTQEKVHVDADYTFTPGDDLYFAILKDGKTYEGQIDKDWSINIKANNFVENAKFVTVKDSNGHAYENFVKVEIDDEYDDLDADEVKFYLYLADTDNKEKSAKATVKYAFDNVNEKYVDFDFTNDADHTAKWIVKEGKKGTAVFDFEDNCYFTVKMVSKEEVILNFESLDYVKAIEKAFDYEANYTTYNFKGTNDVFARTGELFIEADDDSFIYAWEDGKLVEVDAKYVEDYEVANCGKELDGWVIETKELGYYVVSDVEAVLEVEETETPAEETNKANPETGAADFVGAAVAMAVVSVAAAGALALKK